MSDMRQGLSPAMQAVLDQVEALRAHPQWGRAVPFDLMNEVDLRADTVFGKLHSLTKDLSRDQPDFDVQQAVAAVVAIRQPAAVQMAAFLLLAIEAGAPGPGEAAGELEPVGPVFQAETVPAFGDAAL